ncbi:MAG: GTP 3',8-cyclase MoaA [Armatimonadetes bacterium]|nr:GTP 3',8-cyclase MoaA [Armatimonadota bacterium]
MISSETPDRRNDTPPLFPLIDASRRSMKYLRVSVTEACNLRCRYCLPEGDLGQYAPHKVTLTDEEILTVVEALAPVGIEKVRITGGEPLLRKGVPALIRRIVETPGIREVTMTTNAFLLGRHIEELKKSGLHRINVSLDTLDPQRFYEMTRRHAFTTVMEGIEAAETAGFTPLKVNAVVVKGVNDADVVPLAGETLRRPWQMRFIELMPIGQARTLWPHGFMSMEEMMAQIRAAYGEPEPVPVPESETAKVFRLPGGIGTLGFITPMSKHFCGTCDRLRLTANGTLRPCLCDAAEVNVKSILRSGQDPEEVRQQIRQAAQKAAQMKPYSGVEQSVRSGARTMAQIGG